MRSLIFPVSAGIFASLIAGALLIYVSGPALSIGQWLLVAVAATIAFLAALFFERHKRANGENVVNVGNRIKADGDVVVKIVDVHGGMSGEQNVGTRLHSGGNVEVSNVTVDRGISDLDNK